MQLVSLLNALRDLINLSSTGMLSKAQLEFSSLFIGLRNSYTDGLTWMDGSPVTFFNFEDGEPNSPDVEQCGGGSNLTVLAFGD